MLVGVILIGSVCGSVAAKLPGWFAGLTGIAGLNRIRPISNG
jgi:hypothetical protein